MNQRIWNRDGLSDLERVALWEEFFPLLPCYGLTLPLWGTFFSGVSEVRSKIADIFRKYIGKGIPGAHALEYALVIDYFADPETAPQIWDYLGSGEVTEKLLEVMLSNVVNVPSSKIADFMIHQIGEQRRDRVVREAVSIMLHTPAWINDKTFNFECFQPVIEKLVSSNPGQVPNSTWSRIVWRSRLRSQFGSRASILAPEGSTFFNFEIAHEVMNWIVASGGVIHGIRVARWTSDQGCLGFHEQISNERAFVSTQTADWESLSEDSLSWGNQVLTDLVSGSHLTLGHLNEPTVFSLTSRYYSVAIEAESA